MTDDLAIKMWDAYAKQAGGKTFDGKPLPTWEELGEERQSCWQAAATVAADRIEQLQDMIEVMQHELKELQWSLDCKDDLHKQDYDRMKKYADRIEQLEAAQGRLKEALRVNLIRYANSSHKDIDALIDAALEGIER